MALRGKKPNRRITNAGTSGFILAGGTPIENPQTARIDKFWKAKRGLKLVRAEKLLQQYFQPILFRSLESKLGAARFIVLTTAIRGHFP